MSLQGDPLPPSLVDLVRNSPISSVDDLKLLLQQETDASGTHNHTHTHILITQTWRRLVCGYAYRGLKREECSE